MPIYRMCGVGYSQTSFIKSYTYRFCARITRARPNILINLGSNCIDFFVFYFCCPSSRPLGWSEKRLFVCYSPIVILTGRRCRVCFLWEKRKRRHSRSLIQRVRLPSYYYRVCIFQKWKYAFQYFTIVSVMAKYFSMIIY